MRILISLISFIVGVAEVILSFRFLLRLLGANPVAPFVRWMYDVSQPVMYPFRGIFPTEVLEGGYVFEFATLFAIMIYAILGYLLIELVIFLDSLRTRRRKLVVVEEVEENEPERM